MHMSGKLQGQVEHIKTFDRYKGCEIINWRNLTQGHTSIYGKVWQ
jgi:hypothetical protein